MVRARLAAWAAARRTAPRPTSPGLPSPIRSTRLAGPAGCSNASSSFLPAKSPEASSRPMAPPVWASSAVSEEGSGPAGSATASSGVA